MGDVVKLKRAVASDLIEELHADRENIEAIAVSYMHKDGGVYTYWASSLMELAILSGYLDKSLQEEL